MTDLFLCRSVNPTAAGNPLTWMRQGMHTTCMARWTMEPGVCLHGSSPELLECSPHEYQRLRRVRAAEVASGDFYIVADDDCLPESLEPCVEKAVATLRSYPEFGVLAFWPTNSTLRPWNAENEKPPRPKPYEDEHVMEHVSVGGIRVYRKGVLDEWPPMGERPGYDYIEAEAMRAAGWKVGWMKQVRMNHLGRNYSTVWKNPG